MFAPLFFEEGEDRKQADFLLTLLAANMVIKDNLVVLHVLVGLVIFDVNLLGAKRSSWLLSLPFGFTLQNKAIGLASS